MRYIRTITDTSLGLSELLGVHSPSHHYSKRLTLSFCGTPLMGFAVDYRDTMADLRDYFDPIFPVGEEEETELLRRL